jgi:choline dehydrogenase-like flavoprotein
MHIDATTLEDNSVIEGDICIVGAGPAGISIALDWANTPHSVVLLEGGGFKVDNRMQELLRGESVGQKYYPLQSARLHYFGGTSGHWGGLCSPFDPIDFEKRSWVPNSGWPITWDELQPYYSQAARILELQDDNFELTEWLKRIPSLKAMPFDDNIIRHKVWQFSAPTRFGTRYRKDIEDSPNVHLYTNANVTRIDANDPVSLIKSVTVRNFSGKQHKVKAKYFILAAGAIENARLLLSSRHQAARGLGNQHDVVGRYFMEHLEVTASELIMPMGGPMKLYLLDFYKTKIRAELGLGRRKQEEAAVLNGTASLIETNQSSVKPNIDWFPDNAAVTVDMWRRLDSLQDVKDDPYSLRGVYRRLKNLFSPIGEYITPKEVQRYQLFTRIEQSPNRQSRVQLGSERDEFDVNRITLDWRLTSLEKRSIRKLHEFLGQEMGRIGLGRVKLMDWLRDEKDNSWPSTLGGGWHHMGTTRMHIDPKKGVVDNHCKVHGIENLYAAGSSCFTTSGAASPTINLIALAFRLSDHLKAKMSNTLNFGTNADHPVTSTTAPAGT